MDRGNGLCGKFFTGTFLAPSSTGPKQALAYQSANGCAGRCANGQKSYCPNGLSTTTRFFLTNCQSANGGGSTRGAPMIGQRRCGLYLCIKPGRWGVT